MLDIYSEWLEPIQFPLANKFIQAHGFRGRIRSHDQCIVLRNQIGHQTGDIIGIAALRPLDSGKLLTAVAIAPDYQGKGCARMLITTMAEAFLPVTYTFPYEELNELYASVGFQRVDLNELPTDILSRYDAYQKQGRKIIPMMYRNSE